MTDPAAARILARWMRYGVLDEDEFDTVDEAFTFLAYGEDADTLSSHSVVDGETLYARGTPEFDRRLDEAWDRLA